MATFKRKCNFRMTLTCNLEKTSRDLANQPTALLSANQLSSISWELLQHLGTPVTANRCPFWVAKGETSDAQIQTGDFFSLTPSTNNKSLFCLGLGVW